MEKVALKPTNIITPLYLRSKSLVVERVCDSSFFFTHYRLILPLVRFGEGNTVYLSTPTITERRPSHPGQGDRTQSLLTLVTSIPRSATTAYPNL